MPENSNNPTAKGKILYLEDEQFIARMYGRALEQAGYQVTLEPDGRQGLALAQTNQFDIILLDLMLPGLEGRDILKILRDKTQTPQLRARIIILTNLEPDRNFRAELESQVEGYLIKADVTPGDVIKFLDTPAATT
ncbi:MAG: response regulator [Candidatus Saccharimonadales bacterium]